MIKIVPDCSFPDAFTGGWSRRLRNERTLRVEGGGEWFDWIAAPDILRDPKTCRPAGGDLRSVRGCAQSGSTHNGSNRLMLGGPDGWRITIYPCVAVDGCAIDWHGDHFDVVTQVDGEHALRMCFQSGLDTDFTLAIQYPSPTGPTSFGFLGFDAAIAGPASVRWTDAHRSFSVDGFALRFPQSAGSAIVGQYNGVNPQPDWIGGVTSAGKFSLVNDETRGLSAGAPRVSESGTTILVVASLPNWQCLYAELPPFPAFVPIPGTPVPDPGTPDPDPEPEPEPMPTAPPNIVHILTEVRLKYPENLTADECAALLNEVAFVAAQSGVPGFGLLRKTGGNYGVRHDGERVSVDHLPHERTGLTGDVLQDAGDRVAGKKGKALVQWPSWAPYHEGQFLAPIQPAGTVEPPPEPQPQPTPTPTPVPQPCDLSPILAKLDEMLGAHVDLVTAITEQNKELARVTLAVNKVDTELSEVKRRQDRPLKGALAMRMTFTPEDPKREGE